MSTIAEFLNARYDEEEALARACDVEDWEIGEEGRIPWHTGLAISVMASTWDACIDPAEAAHTVRWDPASVLADVAAKRRLVELCATWIAEGERWVGVRDVMATAARTQAITAETVLRAMVQPYAEHPDFDPAWRVS